MLEISIKTKLDSIPEPALSSASPWISCLSRGKKIAGSARRYVEALRMPPNSPLGKLSKTEPEDPPNG